MCHDGVSPCSLSACWAASGLDTRLDIYFVNSGAGSEATALHSIRSSCWRCLFSFLQVTVLRSLNPIQARRQMVISTIRIPAEPSQVWAELESFDSLAGDKPFLMHIGLPIPVRCVLEGSGRGAKRTCYFDHGYIQETVVEWSPPNTMLLSIDRTNMPGRHWLGFENARYDLRQEGGETVLTRSTTIVSYLYPRLVLGTSRALGRAKRTRLHIQRHRTARSCRQLQNTETPQPQVYIYSMCGRSRKIRRGVRAIARNGTLRHIDDIS